MKNKEKDFVVLEISGKQYKVQKNDELYIDRIESKVNDIIFLDKVLVHNNDFGFPYITNLKVKCKVEKNGKNKKIIIFKFKRKKGYRKKQGHKQLYTKLIVQDFVTTSTNDSSTNKQTKE